jgi:hypothetical protein
MNIDLVERRKGPDIKVKLLSWLSIAAWVCLIIALVVFHYARPEHDYGVFRYRGIAVRDHWVAELQIWFELLMVACASLSLITLLINKKVMRRKADRLRYNVVMLLLICITVLLSFLW